MTPLLALAALALVVASRKRGTAAATPSTAAPTSAPPSSPNQAGPDAGGVLKMLGTGAGIAATGVKVGGEVVAVLGGLGAAGAALAVPVAWLVMIVASAIFSALTGPVWVWRAAKNAWLKSGGDGMVWRHARRFGEALIERHRPDWRKVVVRDAAHDVVEGQLNWFGDVCLYFPASVALPNLDSHAVYDWLDWLRKTPRPASPPDAQLAANVAAVSESFAAGAMCGARAYIGLCDGNVYTGGPVPEVCGPNEWPPVAGIRAPASADDASRNTAFAAGFSFAVTRLAPIAKKEGGGHILGDRDDATIAYQLAMMAGEQGYRLGYEGGSVVIGGERVGPWKR